MNLTNAAVPLNARRIDWSAIDIALLDMDGTLLDLNYDNTVWNIHLPQAFAQHRGITVEQARQTLHAEMAQIRGTIQFYSFDYWESFTGLDLVELHRRSVENIVYRPGALAFLRWLKARGIFTVIATNAHRRSLLVKEEALPIADEVDHIVSSQDLNTPKEDQGYWSGLQAKFPFDPSRAFFADDSDPVLHAAEAFGIGQIWTITTPDSCKPSRSALNYPQFDHFQEICPELT